MKIGVASWIFMKIGSLTAILYLRTSGHVYPYFPRFIAGVGEIPYDRRHLVLLCGCFVKIGFRDFRENRIRDFRENRF
jgi:hypothetical protein